jgi:hypothetical protein
MASDGVHSPDTELEFDVLPVDSIPDPAPGSRHGTGCILAPLVCMALSVLCVGSTDTTTAKEPDMSILSLLLLDLLSLQE